VRKGESARERVGAGEEGREGVSNKAARSLVRSLYALFLTPYEAYARKRDQGERL
jgi:hypothetical protein